MSRDIDDVVAAVRGKYPGIVVRQLEVRFPGADDDGIWFFTHPESGFEVQVESSEGMLPFVMETDRHPERGRAGTVEEAVRLVEMWLGLGEA